MDNFIKNLKEFIVDNWKDIVKFFDAIWAFAKETVLKDDSIFAVDPDEEA